MRTSLRATTDLIEAQEQVYDVCGVMQIQPATCPACGAEYDPLRAQAVTVIDGRVRAFCSVACRERGLAPPVAQRPITDAHTAIPVPRSSVLGRRLPTEQLVLVAATMIALGVFALLIVMGRHRNAEASTVLAPIPRKVAATSGATRDDASSSDVWLQPLARVAHAVVKHDRRLFYGREGLPASDCGGVRCSIEIDAAPDSIVMAVHDGVVEAVERDSTAGEQGRFVRINHKGGEFVSSYFHLDGIREDLAPGIPVHAGEAIGTVARPTSGSEHPHFRFAMATRNASDGSILFIDPQPMLALWPGRHDSAMSLHAMEHGD